MVSCYGAVWGHFGSGPTISIFSYMGPTISLRLARDFVDFVPYLGKKFKAKTFVRERILRVSTIKGII